MNNERRKRITKIIEALGDYEGMAANLQAEIQDLAGEERDAFDAMPESLQGSERGEAINRAAEELENCEQTCDELTSAIDTLRSALEELIG